MRSSRNDVSSTLDGTSTYDAVTVAQLDATLRSIDEITNMDVEMEDPSTDDERTPYIVLDTNILLEFLDAIQTFVSEAEQQRIPFRIIIPGAVIHELDIQKNRHGLSWFARRASTWLLKKVKERRNVKGQALEETCKPSGNWKVKEQGEELGSERTNDGLILDCCQYFYRVRRCRTFLCSKDKLLTMEAESVGIRTIGSDRESFSSQYLAMEVFGHENQFSRRSASYRGGEMANTDDDGMDVDDDAVVTEIVHPHHPLDQLHLQVIDHFGELLLELVTKVAGPEAQKFGTTEMTSRHAPEYTRKQLMLWTTSDSLEYLNSKKNLPRSSPRVDVFLLRPHGGKGARRGQEWSRRDWEIAVSTLGKIGEMWVDLGGGIRASVPVVQEEMGRVFALKMRPT